MKGQALITLIFFSVIAISVTTGAVIMVAVNSLSGSKSQDGIIAYQIAQSGMDNGQLRLLRDPSYTGETLNVGGGSVVIQVSGSGTLVDPYIISSKGQSGNFIRQIQVKATYLNNTLSVISQKEIF